MWSIILVEFFALFVLLTTNVSVADETILFVKEKLGKIEEQLQSPEFINKNRTGGHLIIEGLSNTLNSKESLNLDNALLKGLVQVQQKRKFTSMSLRNVNFIRKLEHELNFENVTISFTPKSKVVPHLSRIQLGNITKHFTICLPGVRSPDVAIPNFLPKQLETLTTDFAFNLNRNLIDLFKQIQSLKTVKWDCVNNGIREIAILSAVIIGGGKHITLERQSPQLYNDDEKLKKLGITVVSSPGVATAELQSGRLGKGVGSPQNQQKRTSPNATDSNRLTTTKDISGSDNYSSPPSTLLTKVSSHSTKDETPEPTYPVVCHDLYFCPTLRLFISIGVSFLLPIPIAFGVYRTALDSGF